MLTEELHSIGSMRNLPRIEPFSGIEPVSGIEPLLAEGNVDVMTESNSIMSHIQELGDLAASMEIPDAVGDRLDALKMQLEKVCAFIYLYLQNSTCWSGSRDGGFESRLFFFLCV